jgi:hypothetical protein
MFTESHLRVAFFMPVAGAFRALQVAAAIRALGDSNEHDGRHI